MGVLECGQRLGHPGIFWDGDDSVTKDFLIMNRAPKTELFQIHKIPNPSEKIPGDKPSVFAAHWLPSPAHPSSAVQLLPG